MNNIKALQIQCHLENQFHKGEFGKHYICVGVKGEKWLVDKAIFEATYETVL